MWKTPFPCWAGGAPGVCAVARFAQWAAIGWGQPGPALHDPLDMVHFCGGCAAARLLTEHAQRVCLEKPQAELAPLPIVAAFSSTVAPGIRHVWPVVGYALGQLSTRQTRY